MVTKLNKDEQAVFNHLKDTDVYKRVAKWWENTACLSGKTVTQQRKENLEHLRKCARIIVKNPKIEPHKIFGWWFAMDGCRKPRNIILS